MSGDDLQLPIDPDALDLPPDRDEPGTDAPLKAGPKGKKRGKEAGEKATPKDDWGFLLELLGKLEELNTKTEDRHSEVIGVIEKYRAERSAKLQRLETALETSVKAHQETAAKLTSVLMGLETRNRLAVTIPPVNKLWRWGRWALVAVCMVGGFCIVRSLLV